MVRSACSGSPIQPIRRSKRIISSESSASAEETGSESQSSARKKRLDARSYRALLKNSVAPTSQENGSNLDPSPREARDSLNVLKSKLLLDGNKEQDEGHSPGNLTSCGKQTAFSPPETCASWSFSDGIPARKVDEDKSFSAISMLQKIENNECHESLITVGSENPEGKESENQLTVALAEPSVQRINTDSMQKLCSLDENTAGSCPVSLLERDEDELVACFSEKADPAEQCDQSVTEVAMEPNRQEANSYSSQNSFSISCAVDEGRGQGESTDVVVIGNENQSVIGKACVICQRSEPSLWCKGKDCGRGYHPSCIETPLEETPSGTWYCEFCVQKKIQFGPHPLSQGIESLLNAQVVYLADCNGTVQEKQYMVKYNDLAHVHNCWLSEKELLANAPLLLRKFNRKSQKEKAKLWKTEWTIPERLLQKRLILPSNLADKCFSRCNTTPCYNEWLVKWSLLGYEHATWEFENSVFLSSAAGMALIKDFESRQIKGRKSFSSSKSDKSRRGAVLTQLPSLPEGSLSGAVDNYLLSVNKLRESWHKGQNLILLDEQDKLIKVILFILSVEPDVSSPFLIISCVDSMLLWQSEFKRLAPSINVVAYCGSKDGRKVARDLEFYGEDGSIKFHVLLSLPEFIVEDYDYLNFLFWEAFIVDDCQQFRVSKHLDQLSKLSADFRLLLVDGQLQDNIGLYLSLISFLDSGKNQCSGEGDNDNSNIGTSDLSFAKERLFQFATVNRSTHQMKFLEYWVPVELSTVQLEEICSNLISHSLMLRSSAKVDQVGALSDILSSQRKCCDHPYLVDDCLQANLTKDLQAAENLNVGVKASGKLQLLDRILQEIRNQKLRSLVLFQILGRDGKCSIGDILDDFLRQRFGEDSYERLDSGISSARKQNSLNMFNNKESRRFVFLLENRACLPSVRLSSVDVVIIYSGDWNPASDLKVLHKIQIDSSCSGPIKVFRFYSLFTVEEKALILAKQNSALDSDIRNASCTISRSLLSWGASLKFSKLTEFHRNDNRVIGPVNFFKEPILDQVLEELLMQLSGAWSEKHDMCFSMISKCQQTLNRYSKDTLLLGENASGCSSEESSHVFWSRLLDGSNPKWKFVTPKSWRVRRRPLSFDSLSDRSELESDPKKCRKAKNNICDPETPCGGIKTQSCGLKNELMSDPAHVTRGSEISGTVKDKDMSSSSLEVNVVNSGTVSEKRIEATVAEFGEKQIDSHFQDGIHELLKRDVPQLCQTLQLSSSISNMAGIILDYVIAKHQITEWPETILQAFMISLCWRAASTLSQRFDRKESLVLVRKHLKFHCTDNEVESVYRKLKMLRTKALLLDDFRRAKNEKHKLPLEENPEKSGNEIKHENHQPSDLEEGEIIESPVSVACPSRSDVPLGLLMDDNLRSKIEFIELVSLKRRDKLHRRHELEIDELNGSWEIRGTKIRKAYDLKRALIFAMTLPIEIQKEKLEIAEQKFQNRMGKFEKHMEKQIKRLIALQVEAKNKEERLRDSWLAEVNAGNSPDPFEKIPLEDTCFSLQDFDHVDNGETHSAGDINISEIVMKSKLKETLKNVENGLVSNENVMSHNADARESNNAGSNNITDVIPSMAPETGGEIPFSGCEDFLRGDDATDSRSCPEKLHQSLLTSGTPTDATIPRRENDPGSNDIMSGAEQVVGVQGKEGLRPVMPPPAQQQQPSSDQYTDPLVNADQSVVGPFALPSGRGVGTVLRCSSADLPPSTQASSTVGAYTAGMTVAAAEEMTGTENQFNAGVPLLGGHPYLVTSASRFHGISPAHDPLQLELSKIHREAEKENEIHEKEKHQLKSEMEKELEEVRKRYDSLVHDAELKHVERKKLIGMIHSKVYLNLALAEELRFRLSERTPLPPAQPATQGQIFVQQLGPRQGASVSGHLRLQATSASALPHALVSNNTHTLVSRPPLTNASFISNITHAPRMLPGNTSTPLPPYISNTTLVPRLPSANASMPLPALVSNVNCTSYPSGWATVAASHLQGVVAPPPSLLRPFPPLSSHLPQQQDEGLASWWQAPFPFS